MLKDPLRGDSVGARTDCFLLGMLASEAGGVVAREMRDVTWQLMSGDLDARPAALATVADGG